MSKDHSEDFVAFCTKFFKKRLKRNLENEN